MTDDEMVDGITDSMDMSLSKLLELVIHRESGSASELLTAPVFLYSFRGAVNGGAGCSLNKCVQPREAWC